MASSRLRTALALFVTLAFLVGVPVDALAWGKAGHRVVATLATSLLTPEARSQVTDLLGPNVALADIATWADEVRPSRPNTGPWHYVNIPREATAYNAMRDCARGCVVSAIDQSLRLLQDTPKDRGVREEALRWVVHFVADLHQPPHVIGEDRGGNDVLVQFKGRQTNLHRLWDGDLIDHAYPMRQRCISRSRRSSKPQLGSRGSRGVLRTGQWRPIVWHWRRFTCFPPVG